MAGTQPNWENRTLYRGDNLEFMRSMNSGSVHLIATDPPFNKGRDFHATPESLAAGASFGDRWRWEEDVQPAWLDEIQDDWPDVWQIIEATRAVYGDDMGAFLCFMAVRLMAMRRVLREDGSIYLHCDPTASHYLKALMDAIFGRKQFRNEIVWKRTAGRSDGKQYGRTHDIIFFYTKGESWAWNTQYLDHDPKYVESAYANKDERGRWRADQLTAAGPRTGESGKPWRGVDPNERGNHWRTPTQGGMNDFIRANNLIPGWPDAFPSVHRRLDALDAAGLVHWPQRGSGVPSLKRYLASTKGRALESIWGDIGKLEAKAQEKVGWPTQKPLALYQRIIRASSNPGDIVFDPFAGCATTPVAAEIEGRQWVACDEWEGAYDVVVNRLETLGKEDGLSFVKVTERQEPLVRTDGGETAAPALKSLRRKIAPPSMRREQLLAALIERDGMQCQGCGRLFDRAEYFEIDHNLPRSEGGSNDLKNRTLLCGPCNRKKSNTLTLTGLRKQNVKDGFMVE